jgi:hypothetical protein
MFWRGLLLLLLLPWQLVLPVSRTTYGNVVCGAGSRHHECDRAI